MHPDPKFRLRDEADMRAYVAQRAFAHLFAATPDGPMVAHAPLVAMADGRFRFHISRGNRLLRHLDGATVLASVAGPDHYVSPDWYDRPDQVPTWNYVAVEMDGVARRLDEAALVEQLDALSAAHEARLAPKRPWTRAKMAPGTFEAMLPGIVCFELVVTAWRGTAKLSQNKSAADHAGVVAAFAALGEIALVEKMRA